MLSLSARNANNQIIQLTQSSYYQLVAITGIDPPVANIATSELATDDGAQFNFARVPQRNIVITLQPLGNIETARTALYAYFSPKSVVRLFLKTETRDVYIDGYVESLLADVNANPQLIQVSIICPKPYFIDKNSTTHMIYGTEIITNGGDVSIGFQLRVNITDTITRLDIANSTIGYALTFQGKTLQSGDYIDINTNVGQKDAILTRNGETSSMLSYMKMDSKWPILIKGDNTMFISSGNGVIGFTPQYTGL